MAEYIFLFISHFVNMLQISMTYFRNIKHAQGISIMAYHMPRYLTACVFWARK